MRRYVFFALLFAVPNAVGVRPAHAQASVSDADKKAARDLYFQGAELQQQGRYADALDRIQRAQAVFSAPTHLLRIAECQAALGKLVESAETYRALSRLTLPPNAPAAFVTALAQGTTELPQIEPRIPSLKIEVTPSNIPDLSVTIDDQPMSNALIGAARPVNPGAHRVAVTAPGYTRAEQAVSLKERETRVLTLALEKVARGAGAVPEPGPGAPPMAVPETDAVPPPPPPLAPAPLYGASGSPEATNTSGFLVGGRFGVMVPAGDAQAGAGMSTLSGVGASLALEGHVRFARVVTLGAMLEGGTFMGPGDPGNIPLGVAQTYSSRTGLGAITAGFLSNADKLGLLGELGLGYRMYSATVTAESAANRVDISATLHGPEFLVAAGLYYRASETLRIVPKIQLSMGQFLNASGDCSSPNGLCALPALQVTSGSIANQALHMFFSAGIGFYFGRDSKGPSQNR